MPTAVSNLGAVLQQRSEERPGGSAYVFLSGEHLHPVALSYGQLDLQARSIAAYLQKSQLQGECVLLLYPPGVEFIAAFFGCLCAGVIAAPAYPPRLNRRAVGLLSIAEDCRARAVLTTAALASRLNVFSTRTPELGKVPWIASDDLPTTAADWREFSPAEDDLAYLQYTSGSTSAPRGVIVTHGNILHNSAYIAAGFEHTTESASLCWLPHFHDMGLIDGIIQPLYSGFTGYLMSPGSFLQEPARWLEAISRYRVTHSGGPNFAYDLCSTRVSAKQREELDLSSWKVAYNGAEPVYPRTMELFAKQFAPCGFRSSTFYPAYGLAETTLKVSGGKKGSGPVYCTVKTRELECNRVEVTREDDPEGRTLVAVGRAAHGMKTLIVDPKSHDECPIGQVGEIWVCGPSVAAGYWNRPEATKEVFAAVLKNSDEGPFLRTGDLGFQHDDQLFVTGRLKDLIIIRGRNHYPQDIERTVQLSHPLLGRAPGAAFSVTGGREERLAVVQEIDPRQSILFVRIVEEIRRAILGDHEIQPYAILLLKPGAVPRTSSGKVQRHLCRKKFLENAFNVLAEWREAAGERTEDRDELIPLEFTADALQAWLKTKLASRLAIDISAIDVEQPIHQLGLDSLTALEMTHGIERALGVMLSQSALLEGWSITALAEHILSSSKPSLPLQAVTPIAAPKPMSGHPLSQGQQALWFLQQLAPDSRAYHIARALHIKNEIDVPALCRAFQTLVDRHASLRSVFPVAGGKPMQDVQEGTKVVFEHEDASHWASAILQQRLNEAATRPFDLARGPVFGVVLFSRSARDHVLLLRVHHIVADLWSLGLLLKELSEVYTAEIRGIPAELSSLSLHYADYVNWEESLLRTEEGENHSRYWLDQLGGTSPCLELPTDFPRPPAQTYNGAIKFARFDSELVGKLKSAALRSNTTLFSLLVALFTAFLHRYTGQDDVLVGTPTTGRNRHEFAGIVGYFVNPVVVRMDFSEDLNFDQTVMRARRVILAALEHQAFPFATLVQRLQALRDPSRSPLFQAMFVLQKTSQLPHEDLGALALGVPGREMRLGDLMVESVSLDHTVAQFELTLSIAETDGELVATFEYNTDLLKDATLDRIIRHFDCMVWGCLARPLQSVREIPLLSDEERRHLLTEWSQTQREYPAYRTILERLELQVRETPENSAIVVEGTSISYRDLHQQANQLAHFLKSQGVGPDISVGVSMERSAQLVIALLGILKAGGAYVPLDPSYPAERLNYMVGDAQPMLVLVSKDVLLRETLHRATVPLLCLEDKWALISAQSREDVEIQVRGANLAYVIYTSGSTGKPKGVMSTHRGLLNRLQWMQETYGLGTSDRVLQKTPFGFDVSVWEFFWPLMYGASLVMALPEGHRDCQYLVRTIQQEQITTAHFVPSMLRIFLQEPGVEECKSLRRVIASGEALPAPLVESFHARLRAELHNLYGPTEASIDVSSWACTQQAGTSVSIGRPIANTQLYILDCRLQPVPVGVIGELYIGGVGLARGYWRRPELTAEKFIPDPFSSQPGARLYRTGDLARWHPDGTIEYAGRNDDQIKLRGFRIELGEIEAVLAQHEGVQHAVVSVQEDGSEKGLVAYVVFRSEEVQQEALRSFVKGKLPEYMVPSAFVELTNLPLSANGKINRKALPRWEFPGVEQEPERLRAPTEELLGAIWSTSLGRTKIGIHENFFEVGGHSLLAAQIISRVRDIFFIDLPLRAIFEKPTIAGISQTINQAKRGGQGLSSTPILHAERQGESPLSFAQERMWFLQQIIPDKSAYNILEGLRLTGPLDPQALNASLQEILRRHEVLRAGFVAVEGRCVQRIVAATEWRLEQIDLQKIKDPGEVRCLVRKEARRAFDLECAPLGRAALVKSGENEHVLLLAMHHIVADGWSFGVLLRELAELYSAHVTNQEAKLPALQIQYADYAEWQRQELKSDVLATELAYWKQQLSGATRQLLLPADHSRPAVQSFRGKRASFDLSKEFSDRLKEFSRHQGVTLFMLMLAGAKVLLARYSGQRDIVVGTVAANRSRSEVESLIGLFANTLVLRTDLTAVSSVADVLTRVRNVCLDASFHQELPFEKLVAELEPERDLGSTPLFQVMFAWQTLPADDLAMEGLRLARLPVEEESETTKFDLSFLMGKSCDQLLGVLEYSPDLFEAQTIHRMLSHYRRILEEMVQDSSLSVWWIPLLDESERQQVLVDWNQTHQNFRRGETIVRMIEHQAELRPEAPALQDAKQQLSYHALNQQANRWAHRLRNVGVQTESRVGICMERGVEMVAAQLGILKAGGAYMPLDREHPAERLCYQIGDSRARVVITDRSSLQKLSGLDQVRVLSLEAEQETLQYESSHNPVWTLEEQQLAYVIYTSGSTGRPKGVEIEHHGLKNLVQWHRQTYAIEADERGSHVAGVGFDASVWETWPYLAAGASVAIAGKDDRLSGEKLREWLEKFGVTTSFLPTPLAEAVMQSEEWAPPRLKRILTGGDRLRTRPPATWIPEIVNHYGPTECTVVATAAAVQKTGVRWPAIGRPISNMRGYVLDAETEPVPVGVVGELYIGGAGLARGYAWKPDLTAEFFVPDAMSGEAGARLYRTGDMCRWTPAGELEFISRRDQQFKIHGYRIELQEIEAVLKQREGVLDAAIAVQEKKTGEKLLIAYVVTAQDNKPEDSELREHLQARLPSYMLPTAFMRLESIPLTESGKLDRQALKNWEFTPGDNQPGPRNDTERSFIEIWKELLRLERVGIHDNFFALGGDSIIGLQMMARAKQHGVRVTPRQLFEFPTIAGLAGLAERITGGQEETPRLDAGAVEAALTPVPLSPMQEGILFEYLSTPESGAYIQQLFCTLRGRLEIKAFQDAWQHAVARHSVLRTFFLWGGNDEPRQVVVLKAAVPFELQDWTGIPPSRHPEELRTLLEADRARGFALSEAPLLRLTLLRLAPDVCRLLCTFHHLILDGWSLPLLFTEVFADYRSQISGESHPRLPVHPYRDYIQWLRGQDLSVAESYWRQTLYGFEAPASIAIHAADGRTDSDAGYFDQEIQLSSQETAQLHSAAKQQELTLSTFVQAAWAILLSRYRGEQDIVFGLTLSGRSADLPGIETMIGLCINTLPVRARIRPEQTLVSWLRELQVRQTELTRYEHTPLSQVQKWSGINAGTRLFESIVIFENYPLDASLIKENDILSIEDFESVEITNYPLTVTAVPHSNFKLLISYERRRFDDAAIARMLGHLKTALLSMAAAPQQLIREVAWITPDERSQLLETRNQMATEHGAEQCLHLMFEEQTRRTPDEIALTYSGRHLTYAELNQRANQVANYLRRLGVRPETFVGLCMERSLEMVVGILGILKAGGVYTPIDPSWPTQRKSFVLKQTAAQVLLTSGHALDRQECLGTQIHLDAEWEEISRQPAISPANPLCPDNLAYVIYTSGTTGKPKGVTISHRSLCNHLRWMQSEFPLRQHDRVPQKYALSFDVSVLEIFYPLLAGARLALMPPMPYFDSASLMGFFLEERITAIDLVPSMLQVLVQDQNFSSLTQLRQVTCGGDVLPGDLQEVFLLRSNAELANLYGPTEATIGSTSWRCRRGKGQAAVPIGFPISNTEIYVLDRNMDPVPMGVAGELYIGGIGLARGYLHEPALTAERFVPHCYSRIPGGRLYRTGDWGRYHADGSIEYTGRTDDQVKIRGFRIELGEIEIALRVHPGIRDAVVLAHQQQLIAYVTGSQSNENRLRRYLKKRLPDYMLPTRFVWLDRIPLLENGKVNRKALPAPKLSGAKARIRYAAPRTTMEQALVAIWAAVLKVAQPGVEDSFFELGGDSIISLQVVARAQQQGIRITPRQVFEYPTIAALATVAERMEEPSQVGKEQGGIEGQVKLTPIQRWFFEQEFEESQHYNQAIVLEAEEELKSEWLHAAWKKLIEHHDALRLRYWREGEEWRQRNAGREENKFFDVVELKGNEQEWARQLEQVIEGMQKSLNLQNGPLFRVMHVKPARVVVVIHHLAVDGVSWRILLEDLERAYLQVSRGDTVALPAKTASYQRWAQQLEQSAKTGSYAGELEYWLQEKQGIEPMPRDDEGHENRETNRRQVKVELDEEQTRQLLQQVPGAYHTHIQDVLLTAMMGAWEEWSGKQRLVIDVEGHGRDGIEDVDVSRTVGWFTVVYPIRLQVSRREGIADRLKAIKEQLRKVPQRGLGYGVLRYIYKDTQAVQLGRQPEAEISFNYLGQVDGVLAEGRVFGRVRAIDENNRAASGRRSHLLEVEARVEEGRLQIWWNYSREAHREKTIEKLAGGFVQQLQEIIRHCTIPGNCGFTPSDFPLARLDQRTLDLLVQKSDGIADIYPLSPIQHGLLFHTLYEGIHSDTYVEQLSCTLEGKVNLQAFEQAWQQVIDYHPALRTGLLWEGLQDPLQIVHQSAKACFIHHDLSELPGDQQLHLAKLRVADAEQGFDLARPPLMRFMLVDLGSGRFEFLWSSHHLLLDGWGMSLLLQEVLERYAALCAGTSFHPAWRRPYRDYVAWIQRQDVAKAEEYWRGILQGLAGAARLPGEQAVQFAAPKKRYDERQLIISGDETNALHTMAPRYQITLSVLVQAAWALLLQHYTGNQDVVFGVTVSGRPSELAGVDRMVGIFINTLPLRIDLSPGATIISVLQELQAQHLQREDYAYTPLLKIQEWSEVPAGLQLFETIVVFENYPVDASLEEPRGELKFSNVRSEGRTNYPLTLVVKPGAQTVLHLTYDTRRFESRMIHRLLMHLRNVLLGMVADPLQQIRNLQPISQAERQQLLVQWNDTTREYPREQCIHQLFEEQAARVPQNVAVVFQNQKLTYAELNRRANQLAHYLRRRGVGPEVRVALCLERSASMVVALLGILKTGAGYVALDVSSPRERLELVLAESQPAVALTQRELHGSLPQGAVKIVRVDEEWASIAKESSKNPDVEATGENLAYVSYTSGSMGRPKGVSVPHRAVARLVKNNEYARLKEDAVILQFAPLAFDASTLEIWGSLLNGGSLVVMAPGPCSSDEIGQALVKYGITTVWLTAGLFNVMVDEQLEKLKRVRQVLAGGDVLSLPHVNRYLAAMPQEGVLINGYGPTENTTFTCCYRMKARELIEGTVPIGQPIGNTQVYVLNDELQPVPVGGVGELYIGGEGLARCYENDAALTAEKFVPHPHGTPGQRLYRSGDMVRYREDRVLEFIGRRDRQVKVRGYRVEPAEIEWVLGRHEGVREAAVTVQEKPGGEKSLVACVVMRPDQKFSIADLQNFLKIRLPDYMRPVAVIRLDKLPLTPNGKIDYKALPSPHTAGTAGLVLPRTSLEHAVAEIWRQVFAIEQLSVDDNFFDLGGHSLRALQIVARVRTVLGVSLPLRMIFEEPTVTDQARAVERLLASGNAAPSAIRLSPRPDSLPLSFAQQRLWFLHQLEPGSDFYNVPIALRIRGPLDANVLGECCNEVARRHEVLRTTYPIKDGAPVQQIGKAECLPLAFTDLGALPADQAEAAAIDRISKEAQLPFDLSCGPLLRLSLLRLTNADHVFLLNMHHIVVDEWSLGIIVRELSLLYEAFLARRPSPLSELPIQYADYALWQREWLHGELFEGQLAYWRQQLSDHLALELPTDRPRPNLQTFCGGRKSIQLAHQLLEALRELAQRENSTLFITLLAALKVLMYRYTGQPEITIGTPVAGRSHQEMEPLIGFFVNTLALRAKIQEHPQFTEFLHQVRAVSLAGYANQDMPFDKLVEELHPDRNSGHSPFFQVMFAFEDVIPQELPLPGLQVFAIEIESPTAKFDLTVNVRETLQGLRISFQYNSDLFDEATVERMAHHFEHLLHGIVGDPKQRIGEIALLSEAEQRQAIQEWNQTERPYPLNETLIELLEAQLHRTPENAAVVFEGKCLNYRDLHARAGELARLLRKLGIGAETPVGVCLERSELLVIAVLGIMKAGGVYVPMDPSLPIEQLAFMVGDSQMQLLLTQESLRSCFLGVTVRVECLDVEWSGIAEDGNASLERSISADNAAYIVYTSGSTGTPKGIVITHRGLHNYLAWMRQQFPLSVSDRVLQQTAFSFDAAVWELWAPLISGAVLVLAPPHAHHDPADLLRCVQEEEITVLQLTPTQFRVLMEQPIEKCLSVKRLYCGGEALGQDLVQEFCSRLPAVKLYNLYGPTEVTIDATFSECTIKHAAATAPLGKPLANMCIYVMNQWSELAPKGAPGELFVGGAGLARGYLGQPGLTAERFVPDPFSKVPGKRLYRTGDRVRWRPDGELEFLGRVDHQVKLRGYRIELGEIEAILRQNPEVSQAVVTLKEDRPGEQRLIGYVVGKNGVDDLLACNVRNYLKTKLPDYMVPAIVPISEIPIMVNGKTDYKALDTALFVAPSATNAYVAPGNALEEQIARKCCDLLGIRRIGIHDNFFDLGGHSLLAMRLMTWTRETFQVEAAPLREFFETPTIAGLANLAVRHAASPGQTEKIAEFLQQLDTMSPEEVMAFRKHMNPKAAQSAVSKP
jgi:amino acid adenylation domain-containing protein/non-ribosomal peptide synthase protein (TIGR01720 family)